MAGLFRCPREKEEEGVGLVCVVRADVLLKKTKESSVIWKRMRLAPTSDRSGVGQEGVWMLNYYLRC